MAEKVLTAFDTGDAEGAKTVFPMDDLLDDLEKQIMRELLLAMMENPQRIGQATQLLNVARTLSGAGTTSPTWRSGWSISTPAKP